MMPKCNHEQEHLLSVQKAREEILTVDKVEQVCRIFHLLSDPGRFKIVQALMQGELCVGHLVEICGGTPSGVSHQLRILRDNGVIKARRLGKNVEYSIADEHIRKIMEIGIMHLGCLEDIK